MIGSAVRVIVSLYTTMHCVIMMHRSPRDALESATSTFTHENDEGTLDSSLGKQLHTWAGVGLGTPRGSESSSPVPPKVGWAAGTQGATNGRRR
jgi:hypothetical protein